MIKSICICVLFSTISSLSASCQDLPANIETSLPLSLDINQTEMPRFEYIMDPIVERYLDFTDSLDREKLMNKGTEFSCFLILGRAPKKMQLSFSPPFYASMRKFQVTLFGTTLIGWLGLGIMDQN